MLKNLVEEWMKNPSIGALKWIYYSKMGIASYLLCI